MNAGRIEQVGKPTELYERPASPFIAGFIGSPPMNFFEFGYLREKAGTALPALPDGSDAIGIRPDSIALSAPAEPSIPLNGTVELIEPVGGESHLHMRLDGTGQLIVVEVPGRPDAAEGTAQIVHLKAAALHPFDRQTGLRTA